MDVKALIKDGKLFIDTSISEIQKEPLEELYGSRFLEFKTINAERYFIAK